MLKRFISIVLAGIMILSLAGCGGNTTDSAAPEETIQAPEGTIQAPNGAVLKVTEDYGISNDDSNTMKAWPW